MKLSSATFVAILLAMSDLAAAQSPLDRYELLYEGEEVLDKQSNLIWQRCADGMRLTQHRCAGKPNGSGSARSHSLAPIRDTPWRLPTQAELLSLVLQENGTGDRSKSVVDEAVFPDTPRSRFEALGGSPGMMPYV